MTNYNDGNWHGWNGGECPVHMKSIVRCRINNRSDFLDDEIMEAGKWDWALDGDEAIIAFRVVDEYRAPREWWVNLYESGIGAAHISKKLADRVGEHARIECIKVREVLDD